VLRAGLTGSGKWPTRLQVLPDILAVTVYAIALPMNSFPKEAVNRALLKVGPAAAWRMSCRRSVAAVMAASSLAEYILMRRMRV
jgi:hypothetical protein